MTTVPFFFVDVFAPSPLTGNPVAIVPGADDLSRHQMHAVAREFNQSETTFLLRATKPGADHRLQSFTPIGAEVFGAGHNALGAWIWLAGAGQLEAGRTSFVQEIGDDLLPVEIGSSGGDVVVTMDQSAPITGGVAEDRAELAGALGLDLADFADVEAKVISTGAGHLLIPVRDRSIVDRTAPDAPRLARTLAAAGGEGAYVYTVDGPTDAYARFFNPTMGISEDPATGTAAGPLATRLVADGVAADGATVVIEQGTALGRQSFLRVVVAGPSVRIRGGGIVVADGSLHL